MSVELHWGRQLDQGEVVVDEVGVVVGVNDHLLHAPGLLPALLHRVIVFSEDYLPVTRFLSPIETVTSRQDPLRMYESATTGETKQSVKYLDQYHHLTFLAT